MQMGYLEWFVGSDQTRMNNSGSVALLGQGVEATLTT